MAVIAAALRCFAVGGGKGGGGVGAWMMLVVVPLNHGNESNIDPDPIGVVPNPVIVPTSSTSVDSTISKAIVLPTPPITFAEIDTFVLAVFVMVLLIPPA